MRRISIAKVVDRYPDGSYGPTGIPNNGAVEESIFKSNPVTLTGVPGPNGWVFSLRFVVEMVL